jgi:hypothetical protein
MDLKVTACDVVDWILLVQNRVHWLTCMNALMKIRAL